MLIIQHLLKCQLFNNLYSLCFLDLTVHNFFPAGSSTGYLQLMLSFQCDSAKTSIVQELTASQMVSYLYVYWLYKCCQPKTNMLESIHLNLSWRFVTNQIHNSQCFYYLSRFLHKSSSCLFLCYTLLKTNINLGSFEWFYHFKIFSLL